MIGMILTRRREEFLKFTCSHIVEYEEILDTMDAETFSRFEAVYSDAPTELVGAFQVIEIKDEPFEEILANYILGPAKQQQKSPSSCLYVFDYFYKYLLRGFSPVQMFTILPEEVKAAPAVAETVHIPIQHIEKTDNSIFAEPFEEEVPEDIQITEEPLAVDEQTETIWVKEPVEISTPTIFPEESMPPPPPPPPAPTSTPLIPTEPFSYQPAEETSFFGTVLPPATVVTPASKPVVRGRSSVGSVRPKGLKSKGKIFQIPITTFSSLTDKTGTSTISYLVAQTLADQHPESKIVYVDLNLSNPNSISRMIGLNPDTDAAITTIAGLSQDDFINNIALLTEVIEMGGSSISVITFGQATFAQKRVIANANFEQLLTSLANSFDMVIVDLGKLQSTLSYQLNLLNSHIARHVLLADGSDSRMIRTFISSAQELPRNFEIVVNKYTAQAGVFTINQTLHMQPIMNIGYHRNVDAFVSGRLQIEGTAMYNELSKLGGIL